MTALGWTGGQALHTFLDVLWSTAVASETQRTHPRASLRRSFFWVPVTLVFKISPQASLGYLSGGLSHLGEPHRSTSSISPTDLSNHSVPDFRLLALQTPHFCDNPAVFFYEPKYRRLFFCPWSKPTASRQLSLSRGKVGVGSALLLPC